MYDETTIFEPSIDTAAYSESIASTVANTVSDYFTDDTTTFTESVPVVAVPTPPPVNGVPCFINFVSEISGLEIILVAVAIVVFAFLLGVIYNLVGGKK